MRSILTKLMILTLSSLVLAACSEADTAQVTEGVAPQPAPSSSGISGKVLETMDSGGYTYVRFQSGGKEMWAAGPTTEVKIGDQIEVVGAMEMRDFHSKTLNRTFGSLWFASSLVRAGGTTPKADHGAAAPHGGTSSKGATAALLMVDAGSIPKADDGYTVVELFSKRNELSTKQISVRGKVVKFNAGIMGKNWLHIQDGTGGPGTNDLTVTGDTMVKVGDIVLVRGTLVIDKDFGAGYKYDVIVEDTHITVEEMT